MSRLQGKVAFITGAARGQGRSHAVRLAEEGAAIVAVDVCSPVRGVEYPMSTPADLDDTVAHVEKAGGRIIARIGDVRDLGFLQQTVHEGVDAFGGLDVIVANAGIVNNANPLWELSEDEFRDQIDVNLIGVWNTIKATVPVMIDQADGGSVHLISSLNGLRASATFGHYVAAKHGVLGLMRTLALELGPHMIRVNAICQSNVDTPMINNSWMRDLFTQGRPDATDDEVREILATGTPFRIPWVDPVDVSNAVVYLASDDGRYLTGTTHVIDGGRQLV